MRDDLAQADVLPRLPPQLLDRPAALAQLRRRLPVTVVQAPQGYGKTTLLASWLSREAGAPGRPQVLWIDCAELDWPALAVRLNAAVDPDGGSPLASRPAAAGLIAVQRSASLDAGAFDSLRRRIAGIPIVPLVLVLDDADRLTDRAGWTTLLRLVQAHRGFSLVVAVRGRHPLPRLAAGWVDSQVIGPEALGLTATDIVGLGDLLGLDLDDDSAAALLGTVGSWIGPLRIALTAGPTAGAPDPDAALDYVESGLRRDLAADHGLAVLRAFAEIAPLYTDLISALSPGGDGDLVAAESTGLVTRSTSAGAVRLDMPTVVRRVLHRMVTPIDAPCEDRPDLRGPAARWPLESGRHEDVPPALRLALAAADWATVRYIWGEHGPMLSVRHAPDLRAALDAMPADLLSANPSMRVVSTLMHAVATDSEDDYWQASIRAYVRASVALLPADVTSLPSIDMLYLGAAQLISLRTDGEIDAAEEFAERVSAELGRRLDRGDRVPVGRQAWFRHQRALVLSLAGRSQAAMDEFEAAQELSLQSSSDHISTLVASDMALEHAIRGETERSDAWQVRLAAHDLSWPWLTRLSVLSAEVAGAIVELDRLDRPAAWERIRGVGDGTASVETWPWIAYLVAQFGLLYAQPANGLAKLQAIIRSHPPVQSHVPMAARLLARCRADLLIAGGRLGEADAVLAEAMARDASPMLVAAAARAELARNDFIRAEGLVAEALWSADTTARDRLELSIIGGWAAVRTGNRVRAKQLTVDAWRITELSGVRRAWSVIPLSGVLALAELVPEVNDPGMISALQSVTPPFPLPSAGVVLTRGERAVLQELAKGVTRREMAEALLVSVNTVKTQLNSLYRKLGTVDAADTIRQAKGLGLLSVQSPRGLIDAPPNPSAVRTAPDSASDAVRPVAPYGHGHGRRWSAPVLPEQKFRRP